MGWKTWLKAHIVTDSLYFSKMSNVHRKISSIFNKWGWENRISTYRIIKWDQCLSVSIKISISGSNVKCKSTNTKISRRKYSQYPRHKCREGLSELTPAAQELGITVNKYDLINCKKLRHTENYQSSEEDAHRTAENSFYLNIWQRISFRIYKGPQKAKYHENKWDLCDPHVKQPAACLTRRRQTLQWKTCKVRSKETVWDLTR